MTEQTNAANIVLIGMMGVGKTAVGRLLAEALQYEFVDLDAELEAVCGLKLSEIYRRYGKIRFYAEEELLLAKQRGRSGLVIAAGGALAPSVKERELWQELGSVIWLSAGAETILRRMRRKQNRLFLPKQATVDDVQQILNERAPQYQETAALAVNLDNYTLEQAVGKIAAFCRKNQGF